MLLTNFILLFADMAVYFGFMLVLFRARRHIGIGGLFCALGTLHFLAVYLGSSFFFTMPFGLAISPGTVVLYGGLMSILLLAYLCEGPHVARQPVYGLLLGGFMLTLVTAILGFSHVRFPVEDQADISFLNRMSALLLWGTLLVFVECTFMFRLLDFWMRRLKGRLWPALWLTLAITCTFDQIFFYPALRFGFDVPLVAAIGNWIGKMVAAGFYAALMVLYLRHVERAGGWRLTFALPALSDRARRDPETGAFDRDRFEPIARDLVHVAVYTGRPLTLMLLSMDLTEIRQAHPKGARAALRQVAEAVSEGLRIGDFVVRLDGDLLAVLAPGLPHHAAFQLASLIRQRVLNLPALPSEMASPSLAVGIATAPADGETAMALLSAADRRVYAARTQGRGAVIGANEG